MAGDHWKSLANKLGAPGVDAPTVETTPEASARVSTPAPEKPVAVPTPTGRRHDTAAAPTRPAPPEAAPAPAPAPAPRGPEKVPKRKSSWDTLTSFFGINSSPEAVEEPAAEIASSAPAETDALESPTSRRGAPEAKPRGYEPRSRQEPSRSAEPPRTQEPKQSALDSLFGEAPRQPVSWEKPAPRRMVDDVSSWDEEEEPVEALLEPETEENDLLPFRTEEIEVEAEAETEAPQRRRRRRRRGGARRDREEGAGPQAGRGESRHAGAPRGERSELPAGDEWADEEVLEPVESSERWDEPETFESEVADVGDEVEGAMPERRSSRRRRRGGRSRERVEEGTQELRSTREPTESRAPREARPTREARPPRELEGREPRQPREPREVREPRPMREPRSLEEEGTTSIERPRREPRQRPPRPSEAPRRELAVATGEDLDDEVDSSLAAELEEGGPNRHPKIPTWADSLEAIISANMDNHRRAESQRGGAPRGRPRGGHSGGGGGAPRR